MVVSLRRERTAIQIPKLVLARQRIASEYRPQRLSREDSIRPQDGVFGRTLNAGGCGSSLGGGTYKTSLHGAEEGPSRSPAS